MPHDDSDSSRTRTVTTPSFNDAGGDDDSGADSGGGGGDDDPGGASSDSDSSRTRTVTTPSFNDAGGDDDSGGRNASGGPTDPSADPADDNPAVGGADDDPGGASSGSDSSRTRTVTTPSFDAGGDDESATSQQQPQSETDVFGELATETGSVIPERDDTLETLGDTAGDAVGAVDELGQDVRRFQRETNPIEDFAAGVRQEIGVPAPGDETADTFNQPVEDAFGVNVQQTRRDLADDIQAEAASALESGQDAFADLSPRQQQAVTGAATVAAAAEPTPVGEAALATLIGGTTVGAAASPESQATGSPFVESEIPAPSEPVDSTSEITVPDEPVGSQREIDAPDDAFDSQGEIGIPMDPDLEPQRELNVPDETGTDPTTIITAPIGEQRRPGQRGDSNTDTGTRTGRFRRNRGADRDELEEILSGGGSIGEQERDDIQDAIENNDEFAENRRTIREIIQERRVNEQTPDAEEQVGDPSIVEDIEDGDIGQNSVPGPDPILPPAPDVQDQDPALGRETRQQPDISPGIEQPPVTPETGTGTGTSTLPDVGQQPGQQPDIDVDSSQDTAQQPDTGLLTDFNSSRNAQQPQFGTESTAPETAEPQPLAEATGPGLGAATRPRMEEEEEDEERLFDPDDDEPFFDPDDGGLFGEREVEATFDFENEVLR